MEQDEDGVYVARVPELPGCVSDGRRREEALKNVKEAIEAYLETLQDEGWARPKVVGEEIVFVEVNP
ncbi:MAG TPA: type II toxin-antitoxin system HicB family antitoxin [Nitrososphaerales archaeon]|nr:type II toxin-antitoxin system HicB family antitoxin [Nitrososphaerales archaeon]